MLSVPSTTFTPLDLGGNGAELVIQTEGVQFRTVSALDFTLILLGKLLSESDILSPDWLPSTPVIMWSSRIRNRMWRNASYLLA